MKRFLAMLVALAALAGCVPALATSYMIFPTGPILPETTPTPGPAAGLYVEFKEDSAVYKRAGSGKTGVVILKGSTAYATERSENKKWVKILYGSNNELTGWVPFKLLKRASFDYPLINYASEDDGYGRVKKGDAVKLAGATFKVRVDSDVYKTGSSSAKVIGRLKKGLAVTASGRLSVDPTGVFFVQISYNGKVGWMVETSLDGASAAINSALLK